MSARQAEPSKTVSGPAGGREAQRRRTRRAIVEATRELVVAGGPVPTIDAIAAAADVSRRTVYMHFPTLDQLLLDATLGALSDAYVDTALATADGGTDEHGDDVHARVEALVRAVLDLADETLPLGRRIIQLTVGHADEPGSTVRARRGGRRTSWIEAAVAPIADRLSDEQQDRLVSGLSLLIGFEAMLVLRDVRGLDREQEVRTTTWAARALVDAMLAEVEGPA